MVRALNPHHEVNGISKLSGHRHLNNLIQIYAKCQRVFKMKETGYKFDKVLAAPCALTVLLELQIPVAIWYAGSPASHLRYTCGLTGTHGKSHFPREHAEWHLGVANYRNLFRHHRILFRCVHHPLETVEIEFTAMRTGHL